jgi:hypothetical protein
MKFDPGTRELFTDAGELVKVLRCPLRMCWKQLTASVGSPHRTCGECDRSVLDTATLSDAEVLAAVRSDPSTCLCVRASQENLTLLPTRRAQPGAAVDRGHKAGPGH